MEQTQQQTDQSRSIATLTDELLEDLINPSMSALEMCQIHRLTLVELATILESESFKQAAAALERIAAARQTILEPEARALATARLADILKDKPSTPAHAETQRKAAAQLLRLPRASGGGGCEADGGGLRPDSLPKSSPQQTPTQRSTPIQSKTKPQPTTHPKRQSRDPHPHQIPGRSHLGIHWPSQLNLVKTLKQSLSRAAKHWPGLWNRRLGDGLICCRTLV